VPLQAVRPIHAKEQANCQGVPGGWLPQAEYQIRVGAPAARLPETSPKASTNAVSLNS
jgi:hypothetical protein